MHRWAGGPGTLIRSWVLSLTQFPHSHQSMKAIGPKPENKGIWTWSETGRQRQAIQCPVGLEQLSPWSSPQLPLCCVGVPRSTAGSLLLLSCTS